MNEDEQLDWTPVWSLTEQRHRLLPTKFLYFGTPEPDNRCTRADSNGNAAGSCLEDAILQGSLELVERDAVALWWYNRTTMPGVDLAAFDDPWIDKLRRHYAELGRELWVLDVTSDLGIPVMTAISRRLGTESEDILFGFGAHFDPAVAVRRALTELNQLLPAVLDRGYAFDDPDAMNWLRTATLANQPYLAPDLDTRHRVPADFGYVSRQDLREDVSAIVRTMAEHGLQTLVLDQTRPDIGLPVVKMIVPGLRSFWARFAPGRLYDVPVRLGRVGTATAYEEINPFPMFL